MDVLVIAAHSDDEVLGCAGTLARHVANGDSVKIMFMTDGVSSRNSELSEDAIKRSDASKKAANTIGAKIVKQCQFPDNSMDSVPFLDIVKEVESIIKKTCPDIIYTHYANDLNIDHRLTHQSVMTACRPQNNSTVKEIYSFEVLSSTEWNSHTLTPFVPQLIVNITDYWDVKIKALKYYSDELRGFPHSRCIESVEALATLRGCTNGFEKAESFYIERILK